jgi:serine/threonine protein kinase
MQPGQRYGKYLLLERIAHGGMAEIFKAKALGAAGFEKRVAIKRLHSRYAEDREVIAMLQDEARLCSELTHQNICQVLDLGRVDDTYYIAMEFVDGRDLATVMRRAHKKFPRAMPFPAALFVMREMLAGLEYAHRKRGPDGQPLGIIHRDISPQNVLVSHEGEVKIIDFGIAKAKGQSHKTEAGVIKGKFRYMSPEQARGERIDHRADVFAAGVVLYELILGHPHSKGLTDMQVLARIQQGYLDPLDQIIPDLPPALTEIIDRALSPHPEQRWPSAGHFKRSIEGFISANGLDFNRDAMAGLMRNLFPKQWQAGTAVEGAESLHAGDLLLESNPSFTQELDADDLLEVDEGSPVPSDPEATSYETPLSRTPGPAPAPSFDPNWAPGEGYTTRRRKSARAKLGDPRRKKRGRRRQGGQPGPAPQARGHHPYQPQDPGQPNQALEMAWARARQATPAAYPQTDEDSGPFGGRGPGAMSARERGAASRGSVPQRGPKTNWAAVVLYVGAFLLLVGGGGAIGYNYWQAEKRKATKQAPTQSNENEQPPGQTVVRTTVDISSKPRKGAKIFINGRDTGQKTPAVFDVQAPSPVLIELVRRGYPRWVQEFPIEPGQPLKIEADLRHPPKRERGKDSRAARRTSGRRRYRSGRRRGRNRSRTGSGRSRDSTDDEYSEGATGLAESMDLATLEITSPSRAWVYINGRRMGYTKLIKRLRPGSYKIWIQKGDRNSSARTITVKKGEKKKVFFTLDE